MGPIKHEHISKWNRFPNIYPILYRWDPRGTLQLEQVINYRYVSRIYCVSKIDSDPSSRNMTAKLEREKSTNM